jgi:hypothetical protein
MQYPMRYIDPLKEVLGREDEIIYVENKTNFENLLRQYAWDKIFTDTFAGDFGHCTELGNNTIAKNLVEHIKAELTH